MVRREGTRFGVATGHSVRRSIQSQKTVHSSQNIVVKATTDVKFKRAQKQASTVVENHLQNRALNLKGFDNEAVLPFSLNKSKRWEAVDSLKREIGSVCCHGNHITVSEHHIGVGNSDDDCTAVYDSMSSKSKCSPRKSYARAADLVMKETELSTGHLMAEDEDFGTKNRRRRQKKKVKVDKRTGIQEEAFSVNVSYAVNLAAPKHTLYTFPKRGIAHGTDDGNDENTVLQITKQGTRKRNKKISRDILVELDSVRQLNAGEDFSYYSEEEDDDEWEATDETRHIPRSEITALFGMFVVPVDQQTSKFASKKDSGFSHGACTKERIFQIDAEEHEEKKESALEVEDNATVRFVISSDSLQPEVLRGEFGEDYEEAHCFPRRFAVNITDRVISKAPVFWKCGCSVSDTLLSDGYQVYTIFSMPWQDAWQDACQNVEVSATVVGERFNQMDAEKVIYGYRNEIKCLSDAFERITDVAAYKVEYDRQPCESDTCHPVKVKSMKGMPLTTVGGSLNWEVEIQSQQQLWKQILASDEEKHNASGKLTLVSGKDHEDICRICYSSICAISSGTCLQSCNHLFCDECWKGYLIAKVSQGDPHITCPEFNCKVPVDEVTVMSLVPYKLASFHMQQRINAVVAADKHLQWCPSKGCGHVARFTDETSNGVSIACECGFVWCTKCTQEIHWPATCAQAATYRKEKASVLKYMNAENASIVDKVRYKNCPKCNYPIEKIYGCNFMTCPCKCTFCWVCGELYPNHTMQGYTCKQPQVDYETFEFDQQPMEHVYQLSVMHHFKASRAYTSTRNVQAQKLANKVFVALALEKSSEEFGRQAPEYTSTTTTAISVLSRGECEMKLLKEIQDLFRRSSDFVLEAFSVLEFLEILLESSPLCDLKKRLYQAKSRLVFISQQLDDILNQRISDVKGCEERIKTLYDNGKRLLVSIVKVASDLSNMKEVPINVPTKEQ